MLCELCDCQLFYSAEYIQNPHHIIKKQES